MFGDDDGMGCFGSVGGGGGAGASGAGNGVGSGANSGGTGFKGYHSQIAEMARGCIIIITTTIITTTIIIITTTITNITTNPLHFPSPVYMERPSPVGLDTLLLLDWAWAWKGYRRT